MSGEACDQSDCRVAARGTYRRRNVRRANVADVLDAAFSAPRSGLLLDETHDGLAALCSRSGERRSPRLAPGRGGSGTVNVAVLTERARGAAAAALATSCWWAMGRWRCRGGGWMRVDATPRSDALGMPMQAGVASRSSGDRDAAGALRGSRVGGASSKAQNRHGHSLAGGSNTGNKRAADWRACAQLLRGEAALEPCRRRPFHTSAWRPETSPPVRAIRTAEQPLDCSNRRLLCHGLRTSSLSLSRPVLLPSSSLALLV